jgi:hypothetical protein
VPTARARSRSERAPFATDGGDFRRPLNALRSVKSGTRRIDDAAPVADDYLSLAVNTDREELDMSPLRTFAFTVVVAALSAPLASVAAPAGESSAACAATPTSLPERRIVEQAAKGLPSLIGFVNRTQPIYQLRLVDAVAWLDAERDRRSACMTASAQAVAD